MTLISQHNKDEIVNGIKIVSLPKPHNRYIRMFFLTIYAFWLAIKQDAEVYHFHDPEFLFSGWLLQSLSGKPVIYDVHEYYAESIQNKGWLPEPPRKLIAKLFGRVEKMLASRLSGIVTVNEDMGEKFKKYNNEVAVLPNYPLRELFDNVPLNSNLRRRYEDDEVLIYIGGLSQARGVTRSIRALSLVKSEVPKVKMLFLGSFANQEYKKDIIDSIEELGVKDNVEFLGKVSHEKVPQYLDIAQVGLFLLQPVNERYDKGEPTKYFEYSAAGLPVVISDLPAKRRLVEENENGLLVDPLDDEDISENILYLLNNESIRNEMGKNGRRAFLNKYNWEVVDDRLVDLYKKISEDTCSRPF